MNAGITKAISALTVAGVAYIVRDSYISSRGPQSDMYGSAQSADYFMGNLMNEKAQYPAREWVDDVMNFFQWLPLAQQNTMGRWLGQAGIFWDEVVVQNTVPLLIGTVAALTGFGPQIARAGKLFFQALGRAMPKGLVTAGHMSSLGRGLVSVAAHTVAAPFKLIGVAGAPAALAIMGLGAWGAFKIHRGLDGQEQQDYFMREFNRNIGGGEI